ncbi:MAG: ATP-binding protein [Phaeospirillum sp.]|nr:ATP-binding protein [Phaeospirillum sp.]
MMTPMMIQAVSDDLPARDIELAARLCGWTATPGTQRLVLTRCFGVDSIKACLIGPFIGGCEVDETGWIGPGRRFLHHLQAGGMGLSVSTGTAYQYDLALTFTTALCRRYPELAHMAEDIDRSVHELVANALVHGNLGVSSPKPGMEGFDAYCRALDAALADPERLGRRVEISATRDDVAVEIAVLDHGAGYDIAETTRIAPPSPREHGLAIITAVADLQVEDGGRCAILRFAIVPP